MKLAACAICKNEEKNIPLWLEKTKDFDYRIVVDTGSRDNSVDLLLKAGVTCIKKIIEPFRFDEARNSVLSLLPSDTAFCIWPDFDEYYEEGFREVIEEIIKKNPNTTRITYKTTQLINGSLTDGIESGTVMDSKIHKAGLYKWVKPVHEYLLYVGEGEEIIEHTALIKRIHNHQDSLQRRKHYFEIAKAAVESDPKDEYSTWFLLKDYYALGDLKSSAKYAREYLKITNGNTDFRMIAKRIIEEEETQNNPSSPSQIKKMIFFLSKENEYDSGIALSRTYLKKFPNDLSIANELAGMLYRHKKFEEALIVAETLGRLMPEDEGIQFNLAKCYNSLKRPDDASKILKILHQNHPGNRDYALDYALNLSGEGKFKESELILRSLPQDERTRYNLGWYELSKGNFLKGFELKEFGRTIHCWGGEYSNPLPKEKRYKGEPLKDKTILLYNEGGVGDEMIFARFARFAKERGAKTIMACSNEMVEPFSRVKGVDKTLPFKEARLEHFDCYIPMMNSPNLLGIESPKVDFPYLTPKKEYVQKWKKKLDEISKGKLKIGIRWAGNPKFEHEQFRSLDPKMLLTLNEFGQVFSLQRDFGAEQLPHNHGVYDLKEEMSGWEETLGILSNLDIVVSSCTSIVHAAGAMNVPVCVIVPISPYFTWAKPEDTSDWYDSVKIFRQQNLRSFQEPFEMVKKHVEELAVNHLRNKGN